MMKKLLFFILVSLISFQGKTQVQDTYPWCPEGATWVYYKAAQTGIYYSVYEYIKDTLINELDTKVLLASEIQIYTPPDNYIRVVNSQNYLYMRESNDSVFIFHDDIFKFIYDFNAAVGDTFITNNYIDYASCSDQSPEITMDDTLIVTEINNYTVDNWIFKRFYIDSKGRWDYGSLIKNIGGQKSFIPTPSTNNCFIYMGYYTLFCYSDNLRGNIKFFPNANTSLFTDCHYIVTKVDEIEKETSSLMVFPNPSDGNLISITNLAKNQYGNYEIIDIKGRILMRDSNCLLHEINISKLNSGTYFIKIYVDNSVNTLKFIKE